LNKIAIELATKVENRMKTEGTVRFSLILIGLILFTASISAQQTGAGQFGRETASAALRSTSLSPTPSAPPATEKPATDLSGHVLGASEKELTTEDQQEPANPAKPDLSASPTPTESQEESPRRAKPDLFRNQATDLEAGRRFGGRLDLQFGQATETLQGNAQNEPRPQVYRPVWQAHGTYIFDGGRGLTADFGKSSLDRVTAQDAPSDAPPSAVSKPKWQYGGFFDLGYLLDFNHPANRIFRSRGTTWHVDRVHLNMAAVYVKKQASEQSRWGVELTAQAGKDTEVFGFSATAPNIAGFKFLRHLGPTNVSYLAPVGKGLTLQAGIFSSLIGYDSLYAKDNFNYTRPWGADFTPYLMMGANASYPFSEKLTGTFFVINGYWHLARANNVPSSGGQLAYKVNPRVTVKETVLFGPHQANTAFKFWRFLTDTIVERKTDRVTFAFEYIYSSERVDAPQSPRALMMSSQLPVRWALNKRWSVAVRPEVFWDRDGRWTLARQTVKAFTTTLEYRIPYRKTNAILRLEHRYDDSRGPDGGFFRGPEVRPGVVGLTPTQHLLILGLIFTFDH
jgi:hypothetical protein